MLAKWLKESIYTVVLTGAGMSTECGIPDFRSMDSYWQGKDPLSLASIQAMNHNRQQFIDFYRMRIEILSNNEPHAGYGILSQWTS